MKQKLNWEPTLIFTMQKIKNIQKSDNQSPMKAKKIEQQYQSFPVWDLLLVGWVSGMAKPVLKHRSIFVVYFIWHFEDVR